MLFIDNVNCRLIARICVDRSICWLNLVFSKKRWTDLPFGQIAKSNSEMMIWECAGKFGCNRFDGLCGIRSGLGNCDCALLIVGVTNHCLIVSIDV